MRAALLGRALTPGETSGYDIDFAISDELEARLAESRAFWEPLKAATEANAQRAHELARKGEQPHD